MNTEGSIKKAETDNTTEASADPGAIHDDEYPDSSSDNSFEVTDPATDYRTKVGFRANDIVPEEFINLFLHRMIPVCPIETMYDTENNEGTIIYETRSQAKMAIKFLKETRFPQGDFMDAWIIPDELVD